MEPERPVHIWEIRGGWEVSMSDSPAPLGLFLSRQEAVDWCQDKAGELDVTVIFVWERSNLVTTEAKKERI